MDIGCILMLTIYSLVYSFETTHLWPLEGIPYRVVNFTFLYSLVFAFSWATLQRFKEVDHNKRTSYIFLPKEVLSFSNV